MIKTKWTLSTLIVIFILTGTLFAGTYKDPDYKFQIIPSNGWQTKAYFDGEERLFDAMSPDQNLMVRVRAIHLPYAIPMEALRGSYEKKALSGTAPYREEPVVLNGVAGKSYSYHWQYKGNPLNVVTWFSILPDMAYIVTQIVPESMLSTRGPEARQIIHSFQSTAPGAVTKSIKQTPQPKPAPLVAKKKKPAPIAPVQTKPQISLSPGQAAFAPGQKIQVSFSGLPATGQDWIALSAVGHKPDEYFDMKMLEGRPKTGTHSFTGLPQGDYEVRVYTNWPDGGYTVAAKTGIRVAKAPAPPKQPVAPKAAPKSPVPGAPIAAPVAALAAQPKQPPSATKTPPAPVPAGNQTSDTKAPAASAASAATAAKPADAPLLSQVTVATGATGLAFIDEKGRDILGPGIRFRSKKFVNGYIIGFKDGKDHLFHRTGTMIPSQHKPISSFSDGLAPVKMHTGYNFITEAGTTAFEKPFRNAKTFSEGLAPAKASKTQGATPRWGYIDTSGTFVIQPQFKEAWPFKGGRAFVQDKSGRRAMINKTGNLLTGFDFVGFSAPKNNLIKVDLPPPAMGSTLISMNGDDVLGRPLRSINPWYDNNKTFAGWHVTDTTGAIALLDPSGGQIVPLGQAKKIGQIGDGLVAVQIDEKGPHGYMNMQGSWVIEPKYYKANPFSEDRAFVQAQAKGPVQMIDKTGKIIKEFASLNTLMFFGQVMEGRAAIVDTNKGNALGYVDASGEWVIKPVFNGNAVSGIPNRSGFRFGLAPVCNRSKPKKCGFINPSGEWVIDPRFLTLPKAFH